MLALARAPHYENDSALGASQLGFYGGADVQQLKQALRDLSQAAGWPAVNPGIVDVNVDIPLVNAIGAVVGSLADLPQSIRALIQAGILIAYTNETAMQTIQTQIVTYAGALTTAVRALIIARYTGSPPPQAPLLPPSQPRLRIARDASGQPLAARGVISPITRPSSTSPVYPAGTIAAQAAPSLYRIAVPTGLGSLGASYQEIATSTSPPAGARIVTLAVFEKETGQRPWYKRWQTYAIGGGVAVAATGAYVFLRR